MRGTGLPGRLPAGRRSRPGHRATTTPALLVLVLAAAVACGTSPSAGRSASATRTPQMRHLAAAIVLQSVIGRRRIWPPPPPTTVHSRCPAGFAVLSGPDADPALCYRRLGRPMTITYAAISPVQQLSDQGPYALDVTLRTSDRAALQAITTPSHGRQLAVIVAGQAWTIFEEKGALTLGDFQILVSTKRQADELLRILSQPDS
jgi:hypothetical protein